MEKVIRVLTEEDYPLLERMDTGIEDDYVKRIFQRLISGNNRIYGLFWDGQLVSTGGYSIFANRYAMLGRLRSDQRYRGKDFATQLLTQVMQEAFQLPQIQWVGANTQEENIPARRVLEKLGLPKLTTLHGALTEDTTALETGAKTWNKINNLHRKKEWVQKLFIQSGIVFPYECYYPFPGSPSLFQEENLNKWSFYENDEKTRFVITKRDKKKHSYLHAIYPWHDVTDQPGLWETVSAEYQVLKAETEEESYIWMDLTKEEAASLPHSHQFILPSPWILHGMTKDMWTEKTKSTKKDYSYSLY